MTATKSGLSDREGEAEAASPILVRTLAGTAVQRVQDGGRAGEKGGGIDR